MLRQRDPVPLELSLGRVTDAARDAAIETFRLREGALTPRTGRVLCTAVETTDLQRLGLRQTPSAALREIVRRTEDDDLRSVLNDAVRLGWIELRAMR